MQRISLLVFSILSSAIALGNYDGYHVLRFTPLNDDQVFGLLPLFQRPEFQFWYMPSVGREMDVMTSPEYVHELNHFLTKIGLKPTVIVNQLREYLQEEQQERQSLKNAINFAAGNLTFERYMEFEEILEYVDAVIAQYPDIASKEEIGTSFEGRPMVVIKLSNGPDKRGIFIDTGLHACEWAGPPVSLYAINELTENLAVNQGMLDKVDFYFLLIANPDGYVYAHETFRLWRKTRKPNTYCIGSDPNRNWDWHFAENTTDDECSFLYPGPEAFSEPEVKSMADYLAANEQITASVSIHAFGQYLLYPWGHIYELPPTNDELNRVASLAADGIRAVNQTEYTVGSISNVLYTGYGGGTDWIYGVIEIAMDFVIELPAGGQFGFDLPPERILPVATETWEAVKVFADNVPDQRGVSFKNII